MSRTDFALNFIIFRRPTWLLVLIIFQGCVTKQSVNNVNPTLWSILDCSNKTIAALNSNLEAKRIQVISFYMVDEPPGIYRAFLITTSDSVGAILQLKDKFIPKVGTLTSISLESEEIADLEITMISAVDLRKIYEFERSMRSCALVKRLREQDAY